jgi:NAD(P)-dependent dehydrogenase (short-subunit alcohol dehydrogenase family)
VGAAICERLAASGASVVVGGRDQQRTETLTTRISKSGGRAIPFLGDLTHSATAEAMVRRAVDAFGDLDIVVNAAGLIHRGDATDTDDEAWRRVMSINVDGTFFLSRAAMPVLRERGGGVIVNISSTCGLVGAPGLAAYCASKGAVTNLTRAMAIDHAGEGIRVNAVCPGSVDTPMLRSERSDADTSAVLEEERALIPEGRIPDAAEVADLVLYLCSDASRHVNGANLSIDGGYVAQ